MDDDYGEHAEWLGDLLDEAEEKLQRAEERLRATLALVRAYRDAERALNGARNAAYAEATTGAISYGWFSAASMEQISVHMDAFIAVQRALDEALQA